MGALHADTTREARAGLTALLRAAEEGRPVSVRRGAGRRLSIVDAARLVAFFTSVCPSRAEIVAEDGGYSVILPDLPVHGDGDTVEEAVDDTIDALRDYADAWGERLRLAPNHRQNDMLVQFIEAADDDELRAWLTAP